MIRAGLGAFRGSVPRLHQLLEPAERRRCRAFATRALADPYVVSHALVRLALGDVLGVTPARLRFVQGPSGKPRVAAARGAAVSFNLSQSAALALVAIAASAVEVGVDVEDVRPLSRAEDVARLFFVPSEAAAILRAPPRRRSRAFLRGWSRKEAVLKAAGVGLAHARSAFELELDETVPPRVLRCAAEHGPFERWRVQDLPLGGAHVGAVALDAPALRVRLWRAREPGHFREESAAMWELPDSSPELESEGTIGEPAEHDPHPDPDPSGFGSLDDDTGPDGGAGPAV